MSLGLEIEFEFELKLVHVTYSLSLRSTAFGLHAIRSDRISSWTPTCPLAMATCSSTCSLFRDASRTPQGTKCLLGWQHLAHGRSTVFLPSAWVRSLQWKHLRKNLVVWRDSKACPSSSHFCHDGGRAN